MSTPIPEVLRKAAQEHVQRWGGDERNVDMVAAAMAARDERAAKIGDDYAKRAWQSLVPSQEAAVAAEHIASAIRDRTKP